MLRIYTKTGATRAEISPSDGSTETTQLQGDAVLSLSFTTFHSVTFDVNDYVIFGKKKYWLLQRSHPRQISDSEFVYNLQFFGIESLIKRFLVLHKGDPIFTLTDSVAAQVALIVKNINEGMGVTDWKVGAVVDAGNIVIDYDTTYCDEALKKVAEAAKTEWWVEGQTINIGRCEKGNEISLAYREGLLNLEPTSADGVKFYTRLFPIGSSRNIVPEKYNNNLRLQLPGGKKYIDHDVDEYGVIHHSEKMRLQAFIRAG
jgi:hypothetical protein